MWPGLQKQNIQAHNSFLNFHDSYITFYGNMLWPWNFQHLLNIWLAKCYNLQKYFFHYWDMACYVIGCSLCLHALLFAGLVIYNKTGYSLVGNLQWLIDWDTLIEQSDIYFFFHVGKMNDLPKQSELNNDVAPEVATFYKWECIVEALMSDAMKQNRVAHIISTKYNLWRCFVA